MTKRLSKQMLDILRDLDDTLKLSTGKGIAEHAAHIWKIWGGDISGYEQSSIASAYNTLGLRDGSPYFLVKAAYKALANKYHPDKGGDAEVFKRIQSAYDLITKEASND